MKQIYRLKDTDLMIKRNEEWRHVSCIHGTPTARLIEVCHSECAGFELIEIDPYGCTIPPDIDNLLSTNCPTIKTLSNQCMSSCQYWRSLNKKYHEVKLCNGRMIKLENDE